MPSIINPGELILTTGAYTPLANRLEEANLRRRTFTTVTALISVYTCRREKCNGKITGERP